jgi:hypothetical protein
MRALLLVASLLSAEALAAGPKVYTTPEAAVAELVAAAKAKDAKRLLAIFGPEAEGLVGTGEARGRFARAYEEAHSIETTGSRAVLVVGRQEWPFPIPLVKEGDGWRFDTAAGRAEILNRRIGQNELSTIQAALAYVDAQREYYRRNPQNDKLLQYAQRIVSSQGKRDGLYYPVKAGEPPSPLGQLYAHPKGEPYHGYRYRVLKAQGPAAPGGAYRYVANGRMIGGFALVAYPAQYGVTGVMTLIVSHDGVVYEKDLGPETAALATRMTRFNPDATWKPL